METFSALLAICAGNSPVPGEFPAQRPVTRSFDVFFDVRLIKRLSKHSWGWWFETLSHPLWRYRNAAAEVVVCCCYTVVVMTVKQMTTVIIFNILRSRQNGRHFADDIFKCIFVNENVWIPIKMSLKFVPKGPINNIPALVQIMAWRRAGNKPLSQPMMVELPTHICITRPQWVKSEYNSLAIVYVTSWNSGIRWMSYIPLLSYCTVYDVCK